MAMARDFQSFAGPGDRDLPMSEISGYQPVSRIGEIVVNAFGKARPNQLGQSPSPQVPKSPSPQATPSLHLS